MIVRTYARRTRCLGRSFCDAGGVAVDGGVGGGGAEGEVEFLDVPLSQDSSQDRLAAFSSQDSSPWSLDALDLSLPSIRADPDDNSLDPFLLPPSGNPSDGSRRPGGKRQRNSRNSGSVSAAAATATLMEAQEFGEMMEHVDEVNFALDGLRLGQPVRIRRASLLSLLTICGTAQQRRLLRAQGMAKRIIDSILGLNFDDSPSTVAAAALFYVLASDAQDDHLLDSPSCIRFLLKLLNPPKADSVEDKATTFGYKLLGIRKPQVFGGTEKGLDSSSKAIISKVQEILLSCKEIRSGNWDDEGTRRPELSSKWIALLTMEKACLSTVSFEDTSEVVRKVGGNFKERLRELGGLDAIFNVLANCHSTMEALLKHSSPSFSEIKDGAALQSLVLLLKCLKIMENATFLSKDNQNHLLEMKGKLDLEGLSLSFVGVILSAIKFLSGLSLLQSLSSIFNNGKPNSSKVRMEEDKRDNQDRTSTSDYTGCREINDSHLKSIKISHKRQKLSPSQSAISGSHSEWTTASGTDVDSVKNRDCASSISCNGASNSSSGDSHRNGNSLRVKFSAIRSKVNSVREPNGWISIKGNSLTKNSDTVLKRSCISEDIKGHDIDSYDPFAFDEDELKPSKWELLAKKKETSQANVSAVTANRLHSDDCEHRIITTDHVLSHLTDDVNHPSCESPSVIEQDSNLLDDCLLTSVKVLMNLTNDNPVGCQQIASYGGLDTLASLIINHFPSFDLCFPMNSLPKENSPSSYRSSDADHLNNKYLSDYELDFLVAILGLLVNLVEKDSQNRLRLANTRVSVDQPGKPESRGIHRDVIPFLCSIFLANQGAGEAAGEGRDLPCDDEDSLLQGEREAEMMIIEAYAALLLAFLSIESTKVREAIASCLPNHNLQVLVPVLERFVAFHLTLNMISPETHSAVIKVIESCKEP